MDRQRFSEVFRPFEQRLGEAWRRLTGHDSLSHSAGLPGLVGSSRQRSLHAYKAFTRTSSRQMQDFLQRNRDWHH